MEQKAVFRAPGRLAAPLRFPTPRVPLVAVATGALGLGVGFGLNGAALGGTDSPSAVPFDLFAKLLIVVGLIGLGARALQSMGGALPRPGRHLNVLEVTHLAQNRTLYLVDVADRVLVLGSTQHELSTLTVIDDAPTVATLRQRPGSVYVERPFAHGEAVKQ